MKAVTDLEAMGYTFAMDGDAVRFVYTGDAQARPDPERVRPMIEYVRRHKAEVIEFLQARARAEVEANDLLTRYGESDPATWARQWADVAARACWPCFGFSRWDRWAASVASK